MKRAEETAMERDEREAMADPGRQRQIEKYKAEMLLAIELTALREELGLTQTEVAKRLGVTQGRISSIERAENLQFSTLSRYVTALGGRLHVCAKFGKRKVELSS